MSVITSIPINNSRALKKSPCDLSNVQSPSQLADFLHQRFRIRYFSYCVAILTCICREGWKLDYNNSDNYYNIVEDLVRLIYKGRIEYIVIKIKLYFGTKIRVNWLA